MRTVDTELRPGSTWRRAVCCHDSARGAEELKSPTRKSKAEVPNARLLGARGSALAARGGPLHLQTGCAGSLPTLPPKSAHMDFRSQKELFNK